MDSAVALSDQDVARIADAVALRLQHSSRAPLERISVGIDEVQSLLGTKSRRATQWQLKRLGVKAYLLGRYRLRDIENAVARKSRS